MLHEAPPLHLHKEMVTHQDVMILEGVAYRRGSQGLMNPPFLSRATRMSLRLPPLVDSMAVGKEERGFMSLTHRN